MKKRFVFLLLVLILLSLPIVFSNEDDSDMANPSPFKFTQLSVVGYGSIAFIILIVIIILFQNKMNNLTKKMVYFLIAAVTLLVTLYITITTLHLNITSETKGPVHWHADFEIWVCDKKIEFVDPKGMSNHVGTPLLHEHNDNRIHIEGVVMDKRDISLGAFFDAVGGSLSNTGMQIPTDDGLISVQDGNKCNGEPANLYVFVNGRLIDNPKDHVISPYEEVPPGDIIKIMFTEKKS